MRLVLRSFLSLLAIAIMLAGVSIFPSLVFAWAVVPDAKAICPTQDSQEEGVLINWKLTNNDVREIKVLVTFEGLVGSGNAGPNGGMAIGTLHLPENSTNGGTLKFELKWIVDGEEENHTVYANFKAIKCEKPTPTATPTATNTPTATPTYDLRLQRAANCTVWWLEFVGGLPEGAVATFVPSDKGGWQQGQLTQEVDVKVDMKGNTIFKETVVIHFPNFCSTATPAPTATATGTRQATATPTPTPGQGTPTNTPVATSTVTPSPTATATTPPGASPSPTATKPPVATATPRPRPTEEAAKPELKPKSWCIQDTTTRVVELRNVGDAGTWAKIRIFNTVRNLWGPDMVEITRKGTPGAIWAVQVDGSLPVALEATYVGAHGGELVVNLYPEEVCSRPAPPSAPEPTPTPVPPAPEPVPPAKPEPPTPVVEEPKAPELLVHKSCPENGRASYVVTNVGGDTIVPIIYSVRIDDLQSTDQRHFQSGESFRLVVFASNSAELIIGETVYTVNTQCVQLPKRLPTTGGGGTA